MGVHDSIEVGLRTVAPDVEVGGSGSGHPTYEHAYALACALVHGADACGGEPLANG